MIRVFTSKSQRIGEIGEELACMFLVKQGFVILEKNYTKKFGEIDVIAQKSNTLHFIEVKSVSRENLDDVSGETGYRPEDNMHPKKMERFNRTVQYYLMEKNVSDETYYQIDLALVYIKHKTKQGRVKILENII